MAYTIVPPRPFLPVLMAIRSNKKRDRGVSIRHVGLLIGKSADGKNDGIIKYENYKRQCNCTASYFKIPLS
jgi:hypothetical protein